MRLSNNTKGMDEKGSQNVRSLHTRHCVVARVTRARAGKQQIEGNGVREGDFKVA